MNRKNSIMYLILSAILVFAGMCNLPSDPFKNPEYAGIDDENISTLPSRAPMGTFYNCTLTVYISALVDSFTVKKSTSTQTTLVASGDSVGDTLFFSVEFLQPDDYTIDIVLYKAHYRDTLQKKIAVYSTVPVSHFSKTKVTMNYGQNTSLDFVLSDPDSNLLAYYISHNGIRVDTVDVKVANRAFLEGTVFADSTRNLQRINYFSIEAFDVDSQYSRSALCTLVVVDTVFPIVLHAQPLIDSKIIAAVLPCTAKVIISDDWGIDSVKVSGVHWNLPERDTLWIIKAFLDTGLTKDSVLAWDKGGNRTVLLFNYEYHGPVKYPPLLKPIDVAPIFEREKFDTLYLDSFVVITDSSAHYSKDSLDWTISVDSPDSIIKHEFDPVKRTLYVNVPDVEIGIDRYIALTIKVSDPKGESAVLPRVSFWVKEKNDPPVIKIKDQVKPFNSAFDTLILEKCGYDPDLNDRISWKIEAGTYFKPDSIYSTFDTFERVTKKSAAVIKNPKRFFTGRVAIIPDTSKLKSSILPIGTLNLVDSLKFSVSDEELTTVMYVKFTWKRLLQSF
ncbi:MAG: hypothetical protein JW915_14330 [Chitinispirillaceae bacterium]|nr:hypothetical protein [Chitinispirillaceae bacterium]